MEIIISLIGFILFLCIFGVLYSAQKWAHMSYTELVKIRKILKKGGVAAPGSIVESDSGALQVEESKKSIAPKISPEEREKNKKAANKELIVIAIIFGVIALYFLLGGLA